MARFARVLLIAIVLAGGANASASASTFFVSTTGNDANDCASSATACLTIGGAIAKARLAPDAATINVGAGTFTENVALTSSADSGTAIVGAGRGAGGTTIQGVNGNAAVNASSQSTGNALSHLKIVNSPGGSDNGIQAGAPTTVTDVAVSMQNAGSGTGIIGSSEPLTLDNVTVTMANGTSSVAIAGSVGPVTVRNSTVNIADGATGNGLNASIGALTVTGSTFNIGNTGGQAITSSIGAATITDTTINQNGAGGSAGGVTGVFGPLALTNVTITMSNAGSSAVAVNGVQNASTLDHVTIVGAWTGLALVAIGNGTVRDSHLTSSAANASALVEIIEAGAAGRSLLVQRSVLRQMHATVPAVIAVDSDMTFDSSELLGGVYGMEVIHSSGKPRTVTVAESTVDAGVLGTRDALPVSSILTSVGGTNNSTTNVLVQGSILVDSQTALVSGSNATTIACSDSDQPDQTQAADATHGAISCAKGSNGNTQTDPLTSLFANPAPDYALAASSPAVDAVPGGAITLPAGITASDTDLAGNPRSVDGTGDCTALRDKGALELQGHAGTVPAPVISSAAGGIAGAPIAFLGTAANVSSPTLSWKFSDNATATGATASHAFAAPGSASATLTATTTGSCTAQVTKSLTITAPVPAPVKDVISNLTITPSTLVPASSGGSIAAVKGAVVSYVGTQPATTTFTIQRRAGGRKVGKACKKPSKANRGKPACVRYVSVGSFKHIDAKAGSVSFRFTGRVNGKKLRSGSYRIRAVPRNGAGTGVAQTAKFKVKR